MDGDLTRCTCKAGGSTAGNVAASRSTHFNTRPADGPAGWPGEVFLAEFPYLSTEEAVVSRAVSS